MAKKASKPGPPKRAKPRARVRRRAAPAPPDDSAAQRPRKARGARGRADTRGRKVTPRATVAESTLRVLQVRKWLLEGTARVDIVQFGAEKWGLEGRQMDNYIAQARAEIEALADAAGLATLEWHVATRMHLYNRALGIHDNATALRVVDSLHKLLPPGKEDAYQVLFEEDHAALGPLAAPIVRPPSGEPNGGQAAPVSRPTAAAQPAQPGPPGKRPAAPRV